MTEKPVSLSPLQKAAVTIKSLRARAETAENALNEPIAIVGMACRLPAQGTSPEALWDALRTGKSGSVDVPADRWDMAEFYDPEPGVAGKMYVSKACFIDEVDKFDPLFFRISPREAVGIDPQQRLLLEMVHEALEDAGLPPFGMAGTRTGVFLGISTNDYSALLSRTAQGSSSNAGAGSGNAASVASGRISYTFGFQGPCFSVDTACSSSLVSAHLAVQSLRNRESNVALVAGVNLMLTPDVSINFCQGRMLSPDGLCKSFDAGADGYVRGEGCGVLVLKRLDDALADNDRVLALIAGSALNQDGKSAGLTAPNGTAQVSVIRDALKNAGVDRDDVDFIEAHGTGTSLGDPIEMHALRNVFEGRDRPLNVGSVKASIGHAEAAAGVSGLIKAVMMLRHQAVPPHPCFNTMNPHIELDDFKVDIALDHRPTPLRHIGVSSFGFSGTNAHVVLSAAPAATQPEQVETNASPILLIAAQSEAAVEELRARYIALLEAGANFADLAHSAQRERSRYKWWITATDLTQLRTAKPSDDAAPTLPDQPGHRVSLPKTPFDRKRYWIDTTVSKAPPETAIATPSKGHPLLGEAITLPFSSEARFANRLSLSDPLQAFLADHQVQGRIVVPGAALLDMAAQARPNKGVADLRFVAPMVLAVDHPLDVQMICDDSGTFRILSFPPDQPEAATLHATGHFETRSTAPLMEPSPEAAKAIDPDAFYAGMTEYGILYGPTFRQLSDIQQGPGCATAKLQCPTGSGARTALIDCALQLVGVTLDAETNSVFVPAGLGTALIHRMPEGTTDIVVTAKSDGTDVLAEVQISDAAGVAIQLANVIFRAMPGARTHGFHRLDWRSTPALDKVLPPAQFPQATQVAVVLEGLSDEMAANSTVTEYDTAETELNALATAYAIAALQRLGMRFEPGEEGGIGALAESLQIVDAQRRLFTHILGFLTKDGILERTGRRWSVLKRPAAHKMDALALSARFPAMSDEIAVLARCGAALDQVLTGTTNPLGLLFPQDGSGAGSFYDGSGYADTVNAMVARVAADLAQSVGAARHLRVLEIGAGTGATTKAVLRGVGDQLGQYDFTDISSAFLAAADREFTQENLTTRRLDIESDPSQQGIEDESADIIVAANVLHATQDIALSLRHAHQVLAPGGMLVLVESTQARRWVDLVFGLTEGWWRFTDLDLRPDHPLMTHQTWHDALRKAGFEPGVSDGLDVIVARKPHAPVPLNDTLAVSGDTANIAKRLEMLGIITAPSGGETHHIHVLKGSDNANLAEQIDLFTNLCALVKELAQRPVQPRLTVIAGLGLDHGGLPGFLRSLRLEHPEMQPRLLASDGDSATLLDEAVSGSQEEEVRYVHGQRKVLRLTALDDAKPTAVQGTWLITGGTGGLGRAIAGYLAAQGAERLVLIGRKIPDALPDLDIPVEFIAGDAADEAFLRKTITSVGPLSGVIHAAGLLSNAPISAQTSATAARVFNAKIGGALALDAATSDVDLDHFVLFSSAAGILGAARQANHAFAASFLDQLATTRRAAGLPGTALDWGIWSEIGSAARLGFGVQAEELGLGSISPASGTAAFGAALGVKETHVLIVPGADFLRFAKNFGQDVPHIYDDLTHQPKTQPQPTQRHSMDAKTVAPVRQPRDMTAGLSQIIADILQIEGAVDTRVPLYDYGLDSLVAVEIKNRAEKDLGLSLQISDLIGGATIQMLVGDNATPVPQPAKTSDSPELRLHAIITSILHLDGPLDPRTPLFEYGLDSLVAVEIRNRVEAEMGLALQISDLIEGASTGDLIKQITTQTPSSGHDGNMQPNTRQITPDLENRNAPFPLTQIQEAYWLGRRADVDLGGVSCYLYTEFDTQSLDFERLEAAWNQLIARHDMLRLVIDDTGSQQILRDVPKYTFETLDITNLDKTATDVTLTAQRETLSARVAEPSQWPLFDIRVTRYNGAARLHLGFDLIALDAASIHALRREWALLYENLDQPLAPIALSFRDVVLEEHRFRESESYRKDEAYWMDRAKTLPNAPDLPMADRASDAAPRFKRHRFVLPKEQADLLKTQCRSHKMTLAGTLAAAYANTLANFARNPHFSVTVTSFNRPDLHPDMGTVLGDFTSTMLLEVDARADRFADRARQLADQMARDLDHASVSGVQVLRERARQQSDALRSVPVVFTSALGFRDRSAAQSALAGWDRMGKTVYNVSSTPQVWIDHQISEEDGQLFCNWDVLEGVFPSGFVEAMTQAHEDLLGGLADGPAWDWPMRRIPSDMPRSTIQVPAQPKPLHADFRRWATNTPDAPALVTPDRTLTYAELENAARGVAHKILERVGSLAETRDQLVAITRPKGWEQVAEMLGVVMAGAAYVPLDPTLPASRRRHILEASCAIELDPNWVLSASAASELPDFDDVDRLAYVIYTSGSTGAPKGVMIEHSAAHATIAEMNQRWNMGATDRVLGVSSLSFDLSVYDCFGPLSAGGTLVLPQSDMHADPAHWAHAIADHGVTIWNSAPALMGLLLDHGLPAQQNLRLVLLSGDWIPLDTAKRLKAAVPDAKVISLGGATEAAIWSNFHEIDTLDPEWRSIPYGTPLGGQMLHVTGSDGNPLPDWTIGDIEISGIGLARGYLNNPAQTAERFRIDPKTKERRYRTGDIGRFRPYAGSPPDMPRPIEFLGREDFQVKVQGHRVELGEIETILERHPGVQRAVATTAELGALEKALVAFVVPNETSVDLPLDAAALAAGSVPHQPISQNDFEANAAFLTQQTGAAVLRACQVLTGSDTLVTADTLIDDHGVSPRYRHWLNRTLPLAKALEGADAELRPIRDLPAQEHFGLGAAELDLLDRVIADLPALLTEQKSAADIYLSSETPEVYGRLFDLPNQAITKALEALATDNPISVLEVGGGLGTTLAALNKTLETHNISYHYTDVSPTLRNIAKARVGERPGLRYGLLDMTNWPEAGAETYDVIIATSALHVAKDVAQTLMALQKRLKPGGILLALEETLFLPWYDLNMGLQADFDTRTDLDLRPDHPLLSRAAWRTQFAAAGFSAVEIPQTEGSLTETLGFDVILAQADKGGNAAATPEELRRYVADQLPAYAVPRRIEAIDFVLLSPNGKVDRNALNLSDIPEQSGNTTGQSVLAAMRDLVMNSLGLTDLSPETSLFEVGASSIGIVALQQQIGTTFGRQISLQAIFETPTVAALTRLVEGHEVPTSGLIRFGTDTRAHATKPKLIMMPGVFALPFYLRDLAALMAPEIDLVSVQLPGLYGDEIPLDTIEAQVDYVLQRVRKEQADGPYYLGGHSYGGTVAFEAARRLRCEGEDVPVVVLGDSVRTRTTLDAFQDDDVAGLAMLRGLSALFGEHLEGFKATSDDPRTAFHELSHSLADRGIFGPAALPFDQFVAMFKANFRALGSFDPKTIPGDLILLRTEGGLPEEFGDHEPASTLDDPTLGWGEAVDGDVIVRVVPGDHLSLMTPGTLGPTADHIKAAILKADKS